MLTEASIRNNILNQGENTTWPVEATQKTTYVHTGGASVSDVYNDSAFDSDEFDSREEYAGEPGYWSSGPSKSSGYYYGPDNDEDEYDD